jgi:SET and MYND domain-containing protein
MLIYIRLENNFTRCARCKSVVSSTEAVLDALRVGQEGLDKANSVQSRGPYFHFVHFVGSEILKFIWPVDPAKAIQLTSNLIPILISAGLAPSCHPLLALTRLHQSLLISSFQSDMTQDILDETIRTMAKSTAGLSSNLCVGHPVRGVALAELGKVLAVDEPAPKANTTVVTFPPSGPQRLKSAYETLVQARNELFIGFGKKNDGGQVGQEIGEIIVSLEKEIGVWSQGVRNVIQDIPKPDQKLKHSHES